MEAIVREELIAHVRDTIVEKFNPRRVVRSAVARGGLCGRQRYRLFVEMETDLPPAQRAIEVSRPFGLRTWSWIGVYTPKRRAGSVASGHPDEHHRIRRQSAVWSALSRTTWTGWPKLTATS